MPPYPIKNFRVNRPDMPSSSATACSGASRSTSLMSAFSPRSGANRCPGCRGDRVQRKHSRIIDGPQAAAEQLRKRRFRDYRGSEDRLSGLRRASISAKWTDATHSTGYGVLRLDATYARCGNDDAAIRIWGNLAARSKLPTTFGSAPDAQILTIGGTGYTRLFQNAVHRVNC